MMPAVYSEAVDRSLLSVRNMRFEMHGTIVGNYLIDVDEVYSNRTLQRNMLHRGRLNRAVTHKTDTKYSFVDERNMHYTLTESVRRKHAQHLKLISFVPQFIRLQAR